MPSMRNINQGINRYSVHRLLPIVFFSFLLSCHTPDSRPERTELPSDSMISKTKMTVILADIHTVEAMLMIKRNKGEDPQKYADIYFEKLFKQYGVSEERFNMNLNYYREDPEDFCKMYENVVQIIVNRQRWNSSLK